MLSEKIGVKVEEEEIDEVVKLMQPKHAKTNEGKTIYFPFLCEKQMEEKRMVKLMILTMMKWDLWIG